MVCCSGTKPDSGSPVTGLVGSTMICMIGDPLYTPFKANPQVRVEDLPPRMNGIFKAPKLAAAEVELSPAPKPTTAPLTTLPATTQAATQAATPNGR